MHTEKRLSILESRVNSIEARIDLNTKPLAELDLISNRLNIHSTAVASELQRLSQSIMELRTWAERSISQ